MAPRAYAVNKSKPYGIGTNPHTAFRNGFDGIDIHTTAFGHTGGLDVENPFDAETAQALRVVKKIRTMNPVQARMEKIEVK